MKFIQNQEVQNIFRKIKKYLDSQAEIIWKLQQGYSRIHQKEIYKVPNNIKHNSCLVKMIFKTIGFGVDGLFESKPITSFNS